MLTTINLTEVIKKLEVLSSLSLREVKEIEKNLYYRNYKKGQMLFIEGDPREKMYSILSGYVKTEKVNMNGTTRFNSFLKPTSFFPYIGIFVDDFYKYSAEAFTDLEVLYIPTIFIEEIIKKDKHILLHIVKCLTKKVEMLEHRLQTVTDSHAKNRVTQFIGYLAEDLGEAKNNTIHIPCPMTTVEVAKFSATSRETVSHVLNDLKKENRLTIYHKHFIINDPGYFLSAIM
ncbi:Crp/Fnr family transcriptional regulator [Cytobacillus sp. IB215665]|uniref:Crp/Fnr family transcriptional regulator n=1 Tax=Cytobacillus sp. IB215665 TaxID=3097357 RepID=UPI002A1230FA|nr:Crp/Fnr family transcriptional regulator [Cytobacillus sp. IB215665]MDX8363912.1 Crp/Fnr family transcriptional regulator [Cytobacillus sp. IB215665]